MINRLSKNYSKTLLVLFIVGNVGPILSRTITEVSLNNWIQITSYVCAMASAVAITCISFFTNTEIAADATAV